MSHTKGKWEAQCQVDDPTVYNDERCEGEEFDVYAVYETGEEYGGSAKVEVLIVDHISGGDANLIASAPEMLTFLKEIVHSDKRWRAMNTKNNQGRYDIKLIDKVNYLIRKAEGGK